MCGTPAGRHEYDTLARALDEHATNPVLFNRRDGGWEVVQHFVEEELVDLDTHVDGDLVLL